MSTKLKALGLGLFAMLAMGAFGVMNAGADGNGHTGGHFISETSSTNIVASEAWNGPHNIEFSTDGGTPIDCTVSTYSGTTNAKTVTSVTVTPNYEQCDTKTISAPHSVTVHENGCDFQFLVNTDPTTTHNAARVTGCDGSETGHKAVVVTHPNCTMRMPEQTVTGVTYTNKVNPSTGKHEITLDSTVTNITAHYEGGFCVFLGTNHNGAMTGSATVEGKNSVTGAQVDITATGPQTTAAEKNE